MNNFQNNPYDIAYVQLSTINHISDGILDSVIENGEAKLISKKSLELIKINNVKICFQLTIAL